MSINVAVTAAVSNLAAVVGAAGTLQNATRQVLAPVVVAANAALAAIDAQIAQIEPTIIKTSVGGISAGMPLPQMVTTLVAQSQSATDLSQLATLRGYIGRVLANVISAPG